VTRGAWAFIASAVVLPLLLAEIGDWCPWLAERIVRWSASRLRQPAARLRYEEEWLANLNEIPGKLSRLVAALEYAVSVPRMQWSLHGSVPAFRDPSYAELVSAMNIKVHPELLEQALTHKSLTSENGRRVAGERLEFIGDSVLGMVVTDTLFRLYPDLPEAGLASQRAAVVNMRVLADVARRLQLGTYIKLSLDEEERGGRNRSSILADTLEAIIGAVYLDGGLTAANDLTHKLFDPLLHDSSRPSANT